MQNCPIRNALTYTIHNNSCIIPLDTKPCKAMHANLAPYQNYPIPN